MPSDAIYEARFHATDLYAGQVPILRYRILFACFWHAFLGIFHLESARGIRLDGRVRRGFRLFFFGHGDLDVAKGTKETHTVVANTPATCSGAAFFVSRVSLTGPGKVII